MTHYDKLIDSITTELFTVWQDGHNGLNWEDELYKERAHYLLQMVEEFQEKRNLKQWRATD
jgi:hypothetical protein